MFVLDPRLAQSSVLLGNLPLCELRLSQDARYPWLLLIPRRAEIREVFDLAEADRQQLWSETQQVSEAVCRALAADKMNVACIGNIVEQLHMHVVARYQGDAAWPGPVWGAHPPLAYAAAAQAELVSRLRPALPNDLDWAEAWR